VSRLVGVKLFFCADYPDINSIYNDIDSIIRTTPAAIPGYNRVSRHQVYSSSSVKSRLDQAVQHLPWPPWSLWLQRLFIAMRTCTKTRYN